MIVFRVDVVRRAFGGYVLNRLFRYLTWAMPVVVLSTTAAIILLAMA